MHVDALELVDYRSYAHTEVPLGAGVRVLVGPNAQGKTNVLESLHYLSTGGSHRVAADAPLVRHGHARAIVRARCTAAGRPLLVEVEIVPGRRNRARVNGVAQPRVRDAIGQVRSVLFAPEDLALVRGDPAERRRFLDELLGQRRRVYLAARGEYERVLRQRNALLRSGGGTSAAVWTDALVAAAAPLLAARVAAVHALAGPAGRAYADLTDTSPGRGEHPVAMLALAYQLSTGRTVPADDRAGVPDPAVLAEELREGLTALSSDERDRGMTLAGPHRDDLTITLGDMPAKGFASHGETWSAALALRLACREVLAAVGDEPVVLLDDVFSELDEFRRARLAARCTAFGQVLVTAAVDADVPLDGPRYQVRLGSVGPPGRGSLDTSDLS